VSRKIQHAALSAAAEAHLSGFMWEAVMMMNTLLRCLQGSPTQHRQSRTSPSLKARRRSRKSSNAHRG
jgi:hypothetical protein